MGYQPQSTVILESKTFRDGGANGRTMKDEPDSPPEQLQSMGQMNQIHLQNVARAPRNQNGGFGQQQNMYVPAPPAPPQMAQLQSMNCPDCGCVGGQPSQTCGDPDCSCHRNL